MTVNSTLSLSVTLNSTLSLSVTLNSTLSLSVTLNCGAMQCMLSSLIEIHTVVEHSPKPTSTCDPYFISYIRINPLGFSGSGHFKKIEFSGLASQVTGPGMSSAPSVSQCKQVAKLDSGSQEGKETLG
jgi:hypothetical protein